MYLQIEPINPQSVEYKFSRCFFGEDDGDAGLGAGYGSDQQAGENDGQAGLGGTDSGLGTGLGPTRGDVLGGWGIYGDPDVQAFRDNPYGGYNNPYSMETVYQNVTPEMINNRLAEKLSPFGPDAGGLYGTPIASDRISDRTNFQAVDMENMNALGIQEDMTFAAKIANYVSKALGFVNPTFGSVVGLFGKGMALGAKSINTDFGDMMAGHMADPSSSTNNFGGFSDNPGNGGLSNPSPSPSVSSAPSYGGQTNAMLGGLDLGGDTDNALAGLISPINYQLTDFNNYQSYADKLRGSYG